MSYGVNRGFQRSELVLLFTSPIIEEFIDTTGRSKVRLLGEKQIVSEDEQIGGYGEFIVVEWISITEESMSSLSK